MLNFAISLCIQPSKMQPTINSVLIAKMFSLTRRSTLENCRFLLHLLICVRCPFPPLSQPQIYVLKGPRSHLKSQQALFFVLLFIVIAPLSLSDSQKANSLISLAAIGGALLLCAVGLHFWRMWKYGRAAKDRVARDVEAALAQIGLWREDRPQSAGVTEEREREGRWCSAETLMEGRFADWIEADDGVSELRTPPRAVIR